MNGFATVNVTDPNGQLIGIYNLGAADSIHIQVIEIAETDAGTRGRVHIDLDINHAYVRA